jgi:nucleotide-binding universal stress UspA family protein
VGSTCVADPLARAGRSSPVRVRRVLCAVDFSPASPFAVGAAVALAEACGAEITILFVLPYGACRGPGGGPPRPPDGVRSAVAADLEAMLRPARAAGVVVRVCLKVGAPAPEILEEIRRTGPDVIVMATRGRSSFRALGSVTREVWRDSPRPVLHIAWREGSPLPGAMDHVLCAVDADEAAIETITWAASIARTSGARLTLLHVAASSVLAEEARRQLRALAAEAGVAEGESDEVVARGRAGSQIVREASARGATLVVIGARGSGDRRRIGATANSVVRGAPSGVLTVPAKSALRSPRPAGLSAAGRQGGT